MILLWLLAQAEPTAAPSWLDSLGPFLAFGGLAMLAIGWLAKQLTIERAANRDLSDRLVSQAERAIPALEHNAAVIEQAVRVLERKHGA